MSNLYCFSRFVLFVIAASLVLLSPAAANDSPSASTVGFDIPAQPAPDALHQYAQQAQIQVMFAYKNVEHIQVNAIDGRLEPEAALNLLLKGTGLEASFGGNNTATVHPVAIMASAAPGSDGLPQSADSGEDGTVNRQEPVSSSASTAFGDINGTVSLSGGTRLQGVSVSLAGSQQRTFTDSSGEYLLRNVGAGTREIVFSYPVAADVTQTIEVEAGQTVTLDIVLDSASDSEKTLEEIIVLGDGRSMSLLAERSYVGKKNVVTSTKIGQFPDMNAAEAASRLPGVNIGTTDRGEGRFVSIRGAPPTFNRVKVNGMTLGSPELNGMSIPLDVFPAGQIASIQVTKSVLPSEDANSIGGEINLTLPTAFGKEPTTQFQVKYGQAELGEETDRYGAEFVNSSVFGSEEQFGFTISAHYDRRELTGEAIRVPDWDLVDDLTGFGDVYAIDSMEIRNYENLRENSSFSTILEWKPSTRTRLYAQASLNKFDEEEVRHRYRQEIEDGGDVVDDGTAIVTSVGRGEDTASRITIADIDGTTRDWQLDITPQEILLLSVGGETDFQNWATTYMAGYSSTSEHRNIEFLEFEQFEGTTLTFDSTQNPYLPRLSLVSGSDPQDGDEFFLNSINKIRSFRDDEVITVDADATRIFDLSGGNVFELEFGARATIRERSLNEDNVVWDGGSELLLSDPRYFTGTTNPNLLDTYDYGPSVTREGVRFLFNDPDAFLEFDETETAIEELISDYTADESVYAGYFQGEYLFGAFTVVAGVRVEHTELDLLGYGVTNDDEIISLPNSNSYTDWFPSAHFRWDISDEVIFRSSVTRTLSRPLFGDLAPSAEINFRDQEIESGNPNLEPFYSINYDLSLDWYSDRYGILGVALFAKDIDGFVVNTEGVVSGGPFDGFTQFSLQNAESGKIEGIEFNYTKQFSEWPGLWSGIGFSANYTIVDSEVNFPSDGPSARRVPDLRVGLEGQADESGNFALWYSGDKLFTQVAYATVGDFIDSYGDSYEDRVNAGSQWLSFKAIYSFSERYSLQLNWTNITDQRLEIYLGDRSRLRDYERTGSTVDLLFRVKL